MYDLNEVRTFVSVMETGSLKESAQKLGVSKSTLSRRISHLEQALNQPLLRRQANRLFANEAGIKFLPFAKKMLNVADEGHKAVEELKDEISGSLVVYVHTTLLRGWFSWLMFDFLDEFPQVNIEVRTGNQLSQEIKSNDVCVWVGEPINDQLRSEQIGTLSQGLYASAEYLERIGMLKHPSELNQYAWVDTLKNEQNNIVLEHETQGDVSFDLPKSRLTVDQYILHAEAIIRGKGVGLLPHYFAEKHLKRHPEVFVSCLPEWKGKSLPVYLQYPFGHLPKKMHTLIQYLREEAKTFY
ncbi:MAG: LysR family transcriptional regulator [Gammaproteobacteria bacterium]|jgi:DNA-binding transcriptional LysR family regulator|uniref:LysR family transcriptional regulator n=1 Tax=Marinomonas TaxID=28253 RepID=UPI000C1E1001|nr:MULTISPECIES: LysR family transcriptional regulator [unclassified Marinomonas]MBU1296099.1 LysR family transcriptional regulator [Gammaproteobacteria bacterium]MBU1466073.1 LysR family transcriptional regulator [Gammaproteobacteria bacterium]MBU2024213.1 LysR family transcriptional regulator [Gammaproteobacteria bacterium]MBU2240649.1 LysR family transcriptional regulator [Gammaproteobacteria bacterium]MBU2319211.1 LysR family transcriptional regulator [Gammaproteobacteria bacterium]|tara:strand:- start:6358 stop:7251 length:894 start_codon:yes stop_codon:yes gene_type:complete